MACDPGAFDHCFQLRPHDSGMNAPVELFLGKAAIGAGNDVLAAHQASEAQDALGYELGVLHDVCAVADDSWGQNLAVRQLDVFPDAPFVFVARIGGLDEVGAGADLENQVYDLP